MNPGEGPSVVTAEPSDYLERKFERTDSGVDSIHFEDAEPELDSALPTNQLRIFDEFHSVSSITDKSLEDVFTPHYADPSGEGIHGSFEFGDGNGYTACLGSDFDLIQLTAPATDQCGMVFARGNMPDDPVSILSRAQRQGFGFGFRVPEEVDYRWSDYLPKKKNTSTHKRKRLMSGYINHRWPLVKERIIDHNQNPLVDVVTAFCFNGGRMIQATKLSQARYLGLSDPKRTQESTAGEIELSVKLGDIIRLGCCCTGCPQPGESRLPKQYRHGKRVEEEQKRLLIYDCDPNSKTQLSIQWFEDGKPRNIGQPRERPLGSLGGIDACYDNTVKIGPLPKLLVTIFTLSGSDDGEPEILEIPTMERIEEWLGLSKLSPNNWTQAWTIMLPVHYCLTEDLDEFKTKLCLIAHTTEYILSVCSVRFCPDPNDSDRPYEVALVSNIVSRMRVDIQTSFWQIRLLVKIYNLFTRQSIIRAIISEQARILLDNYADRIRVVLEGITWWIKHRMDDFTSYESYIRRFFYVNGKSVHPDNACQAGKDLQVVVNGILAMAGEERPNFEEGDPDAEGGLSYVSTPPGPATIYAIYWGLYHPLSLFYICLFTTGSKVEKMHEWIALTCRKRRKLSAAQKAHKRSARESSSGAIINLFLRWFDALFVLWIEHKHPGGTLDMELPEKRKTAKRLRKELDDRWSEEQERRSKMLPDIYTPMQELNDRLALLFDEICKAAHQRNWDSRSTDNSNPKVVDVENFLNRRSLTQTIRAPRPVNVRVSLPFVSVRVKEKSTFYGDDPQWIPWEVICVNYAISTQCELQMKRDESDHEVKFDSYRRFLLPSFFVIPSWDDQSDSTIADWWHTEPGCLLASSFIQLYVNNLPMIGPTDESEGLSAGLTSADIISENNTSDERLWTMDDEPSRESSHQSLTMLAKSEICAIGSQKKYEVHPDGIPEQTEDRDWCSSNILLEPSTAPSGHSISNLLAGNDVRSRHFIHTRVQASPRTVSPPPSALSSRSISPMSLSPTKTAQDTSGEILGRDPGQEVEASSRYDWLSNARSVDIRLGVNHRRRSPSPRNGVPRSTYNLPPVLKEGTGLLRARTWSPSSVHESVLKPAPDFDYLRNPGLYPAQSYSNSSPVRQANLPVLKSAMRRGLKSIEHNLNGSDYADSSRTASPERFITDYKKVHFPERPDNYEIPYRLSEEDMEISQFRSRPSRNTYPAHPSSPVLHNSQQRTKHCPSSSYSEEIPYVNRSSHLHESENQRHSVSYPRSETRMSEYGDGTEHEIEIRGSREENTTYEVYEDMLKRSCSVLYHPDHMVASVEDTPDLYNMQLRDRLVPRKIIRRIHNVFERLGMLLSNGSLQWTKQEITELSKRKHITIIDYDSQFKPTMLNGLDVRKEVLANHIMDNRVDLDARYRIIAADICMPDTARLLMYLLHGESLSAIDNYYSGNNHLTDTEKSLDLTLAHSWSTSLTLTYPSLFRDESDFNAYFHESHRTHGPFPPRGLLKHFKVDPAMGEGEYQYLQREMALSSMTFVITGDTIGRTWTCTLLGKPLAIYASEEKQIYLEEIRFIISIFAYDAVASRCIVTLMLTGHMLYEMSEAYNKIINFLDQVLHVSDASSIFEGLTEEDVHNVSNILAYRWVIDALSQFEENIRDALQKARDMEYQMQVRMEHSKRFWSPALRDIYENMVFKQYGQRYKCLSDTFYTIARRVRKFTSYRDGISNLIALQEAKQATKQSSEAIAQGSNIQILTLITITYLPLSLTTSIFGMDIMPSTASFVTFGWVMAVSCAVTFISVFNLKRSRDWAQRVWKGVKLKLSNSGSTRSNHDIPSKDEAVIKNSNWTYVGPLLRFCLVTFPINEIMALSLPSVDSETNQDPPTISHPDPEQNVVIAEPERKSMASSPPPRDSLWKEHLASCRVCKRTNKFENTQTHPDSWVCGIGKKLIQEEVILYGLYKSNYAPSQHLHIVPGVPSKSDIKRKDYATGATSTPRFSAEHHRISIESSLTASNALSQTNRPQLRTKRWVKSLMGGLLSFFRKILLPAWLILAVSDYLVIFIFRNLWRLIAIVPMRVDTPSEEAIVDTRSKSKGRLQVIKAVFAEPIYIMTTRPDPIRLGNQRQISIRGALPRRHNQNVYGLSEEAEIRVSAELRGHLGNAFAK